MRRQPADGPPLASASAPCPSVDNLFPVPHSSLIYELSRTSLLPSLLIPSADSFSRRSSFSRMFDKTNLRWGQFISAHPLCHILVSLALISLLSVHLVYLQIEYDIRASFSPKNSKSMLEERVHREFFNLSTSPQRAFVLFTAKDGGSMLRARQLGEVLRLDAQMADVMGRKSSKGVRGCDPLCSLNGPFHLIAKSLLSSNRSRGLLLDYPVSQYLGGDLFVGMNFVGVKVANRNFERNNSRIVSVRRIVLWYFSRADTAEMRKGLRELTLQLFEEAQRGELLESVKFEIFGDEIANREMIRGAIQATMLMSIGFVLLLLFVTFVVYRKMAHCVPNCSVLCIVLVSILCPLLSSLAAFGLCTWLGYPLYTIMCVTPFLIAGVGVDDAFIMLQSWQHHKEVHCVRQRLSQVMVHVGPSIAITSLTNTIAFGVGFFTPTPQMSLFCLCTSMAVFIDYLLTFTLLAPVIVLLSARSQLKSPPALTAAASPRPLPPSWVHRYAIFLHSTKGRATAIGIAALLYAIGISGVMRLNATFEPSKAFPSDSPLANSIHSIREVFDEFFPISIIVNNPPNISNPNQRALFYRMVAELEALPESWGASRTLLWLRPFEQFSRKTHQFWRQLGFGRTVEWNPSYADLDFFLTHLVKAFQFTVITRHMTEWWNRAVVEEKFRAILERFPVFNATLHDGDSGILNMLLTVKSDLIGSIAVTIVCMALVCSLFVPNRLGVSAIALCISSICFTMVGVISWCGADLDPVTMVDVLLATGFSVDYTAHVAHQYYMKRGPSPERIAQSLHEMCPPMLQAGISTVLCMLPLIFVPTYAIVAFAKTIFAVVSVGLLHGLFFLPVLLCSFPNEKSEGISARTRKSHKSQRESNYEGNSQGEALKEETDET